MISLKGKRILVTREAAGAKKFAEEITRFDGKPMMTPLLQINCLPVNKDSASFIERKEFDWVFFTSKNGVDCFLQTEAYREALSQCKIAVVGPKTEKALQAHGYQADFVPTTYNAKVMAAQFLSQYKEAGPVLMVRGTLASPVLPEAFTKAERPFAMLEVYETGTNTGMKETLQKALNEGEIDMLTFTSPSTVDAFIQLAGAEQTYLEMPAACIGTTTENHAKKMGFKQTIVPEHFTIEGMIQAMSDYFKMKG